MQIVDDVVAVNQLTQLTSDELELLAAYRAADLRGKESILERSLHTATTYPVRRQPHLALVCPARGQIS
jgi:hypothetical protein